MPITLPDPDELLRGLWYQHGTNVRTWNPAATQMLLEHFATETMRPPSLRRLSGHEIDLEPFFGTDLDHVERWAKSNYGYNRPEWREQQIGDLISIAPGLVFLQPYNNNDGRIRFLYENLGGMIAPSEKPNCLAELHHIPGADATLVLKSLELRGQTYGQVVISGSWLGQRRMKLAIAPERWGNLSAWLKQALMIPS